MFPVNKKISFKTNKTGGKGKFKKKIVLQNYSLPSLAENQLAGLVLRYSERSLVNIQILSIFELNNDNCE